MAGDIGELSQIGYMIEKNIENKNETECGL